ncbi:EF-P 5-aminopentanol modification-associated protein YfmH [Tannockella kyphosi]|uniref:EF-P 5-aminopentanol modification-associated protein YfmH n=1 Tax=Tannockella kyphosi TaxID=2899121 RepID=UPI002011C42A|nr:pitrilysin family protein [Tannockella kyphosi]
MNKTYYQSLQETVYHETMENGLEVYLIQKLGFEKTFGLFNTCFGSVDTTFVPLGQSEMVNVEDGVAHFLEHKMFDMNGGDASDEFAKLGASTNAYTSSSRTAYQFTATSNINECIELLLDFVQSLEISEESVEKEKGIITQEIRMYDDDPDWRVYFGSIQNLYQHHPVGVDIAGDKESVHRTSKEMLETCYQTFYHPSNMMLVVVGNIEVEATMELIRQNQANKTFELPKPIVRHQTIEPKEVKLERSELIMDVELNKIILSIKVNDIVEDTVAKIKRELAINILFDLLFSKSSKIYNDWLEEGIINSSFSASYTQERDYAFILIGGDVDDYQKLEETLMKFLDDLVNLEIHESDFLRMKRKNMGMFINMYNSPESIANMFSRYYFEGVHSFELIELLNTITLEDVYNTILLFDKKYASICIVKSK